MSLDLTEFGLSAEQIAQINAEMDRVRTQASQTARDNAEKGFNERLTASVQEAVRKATEDASKTAEQRASDAFATQLAEMNERLAQSERDKNKFINESRIRKAGVADDATVASFADLFADNPDGLDAFLDTYTKSVQAGVQAAAQQHLSQSTPPGASAGGHNPAATVLTQQAITQMVESNASNNGGFIDDAQLFADLRVAQTQQI